MNQSLGPVTMTIIFPLILALISSVTLECAQQVQSKKEISSKNCLCKKCDHFWIPARPHPLSVAEESAAQALYALPFPTVLTELVFGYVDEDFDTEENRKNNQWLERTVHKDVLYVHLNNNCKNLSANAHHGNCYYTDAVFFSNNDAIFSENIIFDDGKCQAYNAHRWDETKSVQLVKNHVWHAAGIVVQKVFEKISLCDKHKVIIRNDGGYCGRVNPAVTVVTHYALDSLSKRLCARLKSINLGQQKSIKPKVRAAVSQESCASSYFNFPVE